MEILNCLNKFTFIKKLKILKLRYFEDGFYIKILAPHHKTTKTFPHHKHLENKVVESYEIDCYSILNKILKYLENKS